LQQPFSTSSSSSGGRSDAQTPVHTHFAHTDNINTTLGRPASTPIKGKRFILSTNDLPSPASVTRKTGKATTAKKTTSTSNTKGNPSSDAHLLAFEDPAPAPIPNPFSADSPHASAFDHEPSADLPGSPSVSRAKVVSSPFGSIPLPFPENVNDDAFVRNDNTDDAFLDYFDVLMAEFTSKRSLLSSRSTDAKSSETPVADDVSPSAARSSKKNKKKNKKMKREL
jgi:hypothetical protein